MDTCATVVAYSALVFLLVSVVLSFWCPTTKTGFVDTRDQYLKRMGTRSGLWYSKDKENYEVQASNQCNIQGPGAPAASNTCGTDDLAHVEPAKNVRFLRAPGGVTCTCQTPVKPGSRLGVVTDMSLSEICPYDGSPKAMGSSY